MANHFAPQWALEWELLAVLGIGTAVIVALAAVAARCKVSAVWQAAVWRIATLSVFLLLVLELTGLGQAIVQLCRQRAGWAFECQSVDAAGTLPPAAEGPAMAERASGTASLAVFPDHGLETCLPADQCCASVPGEGMSPPTYASSSSAMTSDTAIDAGLTSLAAAKPTAPSSDAQSSPHTACADYVARSWWLAAVWALGSVAVLGRLLGGRGMAWIFRRRGTPCDDEAVVAQLASLKSVFGMRGTVAVLISPRVAAPVVLGGWRPALVLPPRFTRDFDSKQQEAILAHELAHLMSRDPAWQAAALVLCGLLWWHPLVWWTRRQLRAANEALADEASLAVPDGPRVLAEALVLLGQRLVRLQPRFGLSLGGSRFRSGLGRRVQRLLGLPRGPWPAPRRARLAFAHFSLPVLMALAAIVGTAGVPSQVPLMQGETTMSVVSNSWRCSLVATALWTMLTAAPAPAVADDQPVKGPEVAADREKIEQQLRSIKETVAQLEKEGKHDEAEKLKREAHEMMSKFHASQGGATAPQPPTAGPEAEKIRGRLKELGEKVAQLEKEGKHDEAEHLKNEARAILSKLNPHEGPMGAPGGPEAEMIRGRLKEIGEKVAQLEKEGKHEDAQRLKNEAGAIYSRLNPHADAGAGPGRPEGDQQLRQQMQAIHERIEKAMQEGKPEVAQRLKQEAEALMRAKMSQPGGNGDARMEHLRAAAENLMAAGCEPEARHVMQMISQMQGERSGEKRPRDEGRAREEPRARGEPQPSPDGRRGERSPAPPNPRENGNAPAVQELRGQIEQMRREMRELREELNRANSNNGDRKTR
jgi:hypothetical protein